MYQYLKTKSRVPMAIFQTLEEMDKDAGLVIVQ